jgi:hypothetical protein
MRATTMTIIWTACANGYEGTASLRTNKQIGCGKVMPGGRYFIVPVEDKWRISYQADGDDKVETLEQLESTLGAAKVVAQEHHEDRYENREKPPEAVPKAQQHSASERPDTVEAALRKIETDLAYRTPQNDRMLRYVVLERERGAALLEYVTRACGSVDKEVKP